MKPAQHPPAPAHAAHPQPAGAAVPLIELSDISRSFRNGEIETRVLQGIDLKIYAGEFIAIMGASGSGKSTLMNILGCLDRARTDTASSPTM